MSSRLRWMSDWLTGPSLGQYLKVRPGDKVQHVGSTKTTEKGLHSTKQILKEHMVDSFFERALHQINPEREVEVKEDEVAVLEEPFVAPVNVEPLHDVVPHEPIYEAELPLDDSFLVVDENTYVEEAPSPAAPASTKDTRVGYYVFAIMLGQFEFELPDISIESGYPLFAFPFGSAQAVISKVPLNIYSEEALQAKLNDPSWFEETLRTHTQILGQVQAQASIVPMRVCTICDSMRGLEAFLNEHHDDFVSTLELIDGNHSWRFNIYCNEPRLRTLTAKASNRVRAIQAEIAGKSKKDAQPLHEKMEAVLEEEARSVCKACVKHSHGTLSSLASKNQVQPLTEEQAGETSRRDIFRCDYLISIANKESFKKEIFTLIESYKSLGFELEIEGPHSPAQFAGRKVLPATSFTIPANSTPATA